MGVGGGEGGGLQHPFRGMNEHAWVARAQHHVGGGDSPAPGGLVEAKSRLLILLLSHKIS